MIITKRIVVLLVFLGISLGLFVFNRWELVEVAKAQDSQPMNLAAQNTYVAPFFENEKLSFQVNSMGFKAGAAVLFFEGRVKLNGKYAYRVKFDTSTFNVKDAEDIYADMETYLPIQVIRNLDVWGNKEDLLEDYDQVNNKVDIYSLKSDGQKVLKQTIQNDNHLENVMLMIYRLRIKEDFKVGDTFDLNFPTKKMKAKVSKIEKVTVPAGTFEAFAVVTTPSKFKFWLSADKKRLPLKIDGASGISRAVMLLTEIGNRGKE